VGGPADFHQLAVSATYPPTIYGAYRGQLQVSQDGGRTWEVVGPAPQRLINIAASSKPSTLYAATQVGLLKSEDGGRTWHDACWLRQPATMVHVTPGGVVYAFMVCAGLIAARGARAELADRQRAWLRRELRPAFGGQSGAQHQGVRHHRQSANEDAGGACERRCRQDLGAAGQRDPLRRGLAEHRKRNSGNVLAR
jgi:hypothetical protein